MGAENGFSPRPSENRFPPGPVPAENRFPPTSQKYSIYIHTTYIQIIINIIINTVGFPWERVPAVRLRNGFPPTDIHMYMVYWTYVRRE